MKTTTKLQFLTLFLAMFAMSCNVSDPKELYNSEFKWTITMPKNFEKISDQKLAEEQNKGSKALEKTMGTKVDVQGVKKILSFESDRVNTLIANYIIRDSSEGDFREECIGIDNILYNTFKSKFPDAVIDTSISEEKIDGLDFQKFKIITKVHNGAETMFVYSRLFGNKEFTVTINYIDPKKGKEILNSWKESKFAK